MPRPLPQPLPPEARTVGQVVAEAIRLYGRRFWPALALGLPLLVFDQLALGHSAGGRAAVFAAAAPCFATAYAAASVLATGARPSPRSFAVAVALGTAVLAPVALLISWFALLAVAYLALVGLVVPVAIVETRGPLDAFRRAGELGRADYIHALGSLAALVIVFFVARIGLVALLQAQAENTVRIAVALADLVLSPLLFLGAALLYFDQAARVVHSGSRTRRRSDADVHPAVDADGSGRADPEVQP